MDKTNVKNEVENQVPVTAEKQKVINIGAIKANRELRKQQKAAEKAADTSPKTKRSIWEKIGIGSSYVAVGAAAAGAAVAVMKHLDANGIEVGPSALAVPGTEDLDLHSMVNDAVKMVDPSAEVVDF